MICPNCSTDNVAGAKFCRECGQTLAAGCPNCGFVNLPNSKFCSECGTTLGAGAAARPASAAAAEPAAPVAERRLVSVLFADLVGFTPFAEERDSEDVRETLSRYFDVARETIERYGGTVEKFIGDAVMAVWGAPTAHEDDAERAVRAALELVDAVTVLGEGIQARAGVLTGEAAVTVGATNQGMVAGDLVNTASRLQSVAPPGSVLVGEQTQLATAAAIAYEQAGEQALKGKQAPVAAWRALRVVAERGGRNRAGTLEAPFVGRTEEMRFLKELFHASGREKRVRVVSVIGPAGIGKSRLAREFSLYIDGLTEAVYWHSGRSPAYGEGISFWALGEMVRERCELREGDNETTTRERVRTTVGQFVTDGTEREWIEKALLILLGVDSGMAADQLFGAWRTFFERISEQGTVVLAFEDMHFADTGLLDFVDHLLEWSRGLPIFVVTMARPDLIERRPNWGAGKRNFASLYLEPLSDTDMRALLAGLVPGLPPAAAGSIVARADGIPLYAVEMVRALLAEGRLVEQAGVYVPQGDLTALTVPATLTALIASRLDALDETDRRVIRDAAVLGQSFTSGGLAAIAEISAEELEPRLAGLVRRELLQRQLDARSPEAGQYEFVQALIREVAYNTLSKRDRKKLHLAAARYFEALGSDEIAGALASHYLAAHANAGEGPEADALAGQARIALKAAATRAEALGSFDQAVSFVEQAMSVTTDERERVELTQQAATDARTGGHADRAEALFRQGLEQAAALDDRDLVGRLTAGLGWILSLAFRSDEARALVEPLLADLAGLSETTVIELRQTAARLHFAANEYRQALADLEPLLEVAERHDLPRPLATALMTKANVLYGLGRRREAWGLAFAARDVAAEHGLTDQSLRVATAIAGGYTDLDLSAALATWRDTLALARKSGQRSMLLHAVGNYGYTAFLAGEWDTGLAELDALLAEDMPANNRLIMLNNALVVRAARGESIADGLAEMERLGAEMTGHWHTFLADARANAAQAQGDLAAARDSFVEICDSDPAQGPEYFYRAARAALWQRDIADGRGLLERLDAAGGFGPITAARRQAIRAGIAALEGRTAEALSLYREALANLRSAKAVWDEALTCLDMVQLLDPAEPEVAAVVAPARATLERLRAAPYVAWLDAAVARAGQKAPTSGSAPAAGPSTATVVGAATAEK